jgi:D-glycero-D-manno-heptose 1,7-bisphosphate phosphatase
MVFMEGIFELCREARGKGYLLVIVTNQSGIGRGLFTHEEYGDLTEWMLGEFRAAGCPIDLVKHCPALPDSGDPNRKPAPGMILDAAQALDIDLANSIMIGDRASDMLAGSSAGVGCLLLLGAGEDGGVHGVTRIAELGNAIKHLISFSHGEQ